MAETIIDPEAEVQRQRWRWASLRELFLAIFGSVTSAAIIAIATLVWNNALRLNTLENNATNDRAVTKAALDELNATAIRVGNKQDRILELMIEASKK